jgi:predicted AAA+ superfamily ATPase
MDSQITGHIQQQLANADAWMEGWIRNAKGQVLPERYMGIKTQQYVNDFMNGEIAKRSVIIPGLRGVGKTTLLAQMYRYVRDSFGENVHMLRLSLHDVVNIVGSDLNEAIQQYEQLLGSSLERLDKPVFLFLDEVQDDPLWADVIFSLSERTRKLFIFCSGSSAIYLKRNANMVRRSYIEPLYPLNFTEYQMLRFGVTPVKHLKNSLKQAAFASESAEEAHQRVTALLPQIRSYRTKIDAKTFTHFMYTGSMPFLINETNPTQVFNDIISLIERIISEDLTQIGTFDVTTLSTVKPLLFILADADVISRDKLASRFKIDSRVLGSLLDALVQTELLIEVPARGSQKVALNKPKKYLFMSPAIRASFYQIAGMQATDETRKGRLLEDLVGLYMHREYVTKNLAHFTYNAGNGHSDFTLLTKAGARIPIEVGLGKKDARQVSTTMAEFESTYGIVLSATSLGVDKTRNILYLPTSIFYLM